MLRPYQIPIYERSVPILQEHKLLYLALEMRLGKSTISMYLAENYGAKNVLFVTGKKIISSVQKDYERELAENNLSYNMRIVNYESLHKVDPVYDFVILDEASKFGAFPKPNQSIKELRRIIGKTTPVILLSGTPTPESYSQIFHELYVSPFSPFAKYKSFYVWARDYVNIQKVKRGAFEVNDYKKARWSEIEPKIKHIFVTETQQGAGFEQASVTERVILLPTPQSIQKFANRLKKDRIIESGDRVLLADTPVKLLGKLHQIYSGTVLTEAKERVILSDYKAQYIKETYKNDKIAIFYKFQAERDLLEAVLGKENLTSDPFEFAETDKTFISQIRPGSMGINLSTAKYLVFYNIDFSATLYWQARARLSDYNRTTPPEVHWLFSDKGVEREVYDAVSNKKSFTTSYFLKQGGMQND